MDDRREGLFGPRSLSWKVNREAAVFLGAGRASLLQLAHPWVATALAQHSNLLHQPIERFHSTFRVIYTMLFGTSEQALEASKRLDRRHASIRGELPQGGQYYAGEVSALLWVYGTLVDSALLAYETVLPPLAVLEREQYYEESKRMAALFSIPVEALPPTWSDFAQYMESMYASPRLGVDTQARALGNSVMSGVGTAIRPPQWYRALTASWLTPSLRDAFELTYGLSEQHAVESAARWLPRVYRSLPAALRFVGPFHEAQARLKGKQPGLLTRRSNQFWMGQPRLL